MGLSRISREQHASTSSAVLTGLDPPGPWIGRGRFGRGQNRQLIGRRARGQTTHRLYDGPWWEDSVGFVWWTGLARWALRLHDGPQDMRPWSRWGV